MRNEGSPLIDVAVIELAPDGSLLPEPLTTEVASLQNAELVRLLDLVVLHKAMDGSLTVREPSQAQDLGDLGDLGDLVAHLPGVLSADDIGMLAAEVRPGRSALVLVWESTWADCLLTIAGECGARVLAGAQVGLRNRAMRPD